MRKNNVNLSYQRQKLGAYVRHTHKTHKVSGPNIVLTSPAIFSSSIQLKAAVSILGFREVTCVFY